MIDALITVDERRADIIKKNKIVALAAVECAAKKIRNIPAENIVAGIAVDNNGGEICLYCSEKVVATSAPDGGVIDSDIHLISANPGNYIVVSLSSQEIGGS